MAIHEALTLPQLPKPLLRLVAQSFLKPTTQTALLFNLYQTAVPAMDLQPKNFSFFFPVPYNEVMP